MGGGKGRVDGVETDDVGVMQGVVEGDFATDGGAYLGWGDYFRGEAEMRGGRGGG